MHSSRFCGCWGLNWLCCLYRDCRSGLFLHCWEPGRDCSCLLILSWALVNWNCNVFFILFHELHFVRLQGLGCNWMYPITVSLNIFERWMINHFPHFSDLSAPDQYRWEMIIFWVRKHRKTGFQLMWFLTAASEAKNSAKKIFKFTIYNASKMRLFFSVDWILDGIIIIS